MREFGVLGQDADGGFAFYQTAQEQEPLFAGEQLQHARSQAGAFLQFGDFSGGGAQGSGAHLLNVEDTHARSRSAGLTL